MPQAKLPQGLYLIPETGRAANHYLIEGAEGSTLIEAALPPTRFQLPPGRKPISRIIATHGHFDHIGAWAEWKQAGARLFLPKGDQAYLRDSSLSGLHFLGHCEPLPEADSYYEEGEILTLGAEGELLVLHTPGHTPGSSCLLWKREGEPIALFTGDTLIGTSIGRTDFPGSDPAAMETSLRRLATFLPDLPAELPLLSGHGPVLTVEQVLSYNPWLREDRG